MKHANRRSFLPRNAALALLDGVLEGWGPTDFAAWSRNALVESHYMRLTRPALGRFRVVEHGAGSVEFALEPSAADENISSDAVRAIGGAARARVVRVLAALVRSPHDESFLTAARFAQRVVESTTSDGRTVWTPALVEGEALSTIVLTLFAADMLYDRDPYTSLLSVCDTCGRVSFSSFHGRTFCESHAPTAVGHTEYS